jgi:hypothetical protein
VDGDGGRRGAGAQAQPQQCNDADVHGRSPIG